LRRALCLLALGEVRHTPMKAAVVIDFLPACMFRRTARSRNWDKCTLWQQHNSHPQQLSRFNSSYLCWLQKKRAASCFCKASWRQFLEIDIYRRCCASRLLVCRILAITKPAVVYHGFGVASSAWLALSEPEKHRHIYKELGHDFILGLLWAGGRGTDSSWMVS